MDSALCASIASQKFKIAFLHVNYGQRTQNRELKAFNDLAGYFKVSKKLVVDISHLRQIGGSSLTDVTMKIKKAKFDSSGIPDTYVPFRNANILSIAVSWAEVIKAKKIFIGAMEEDSSGYPDCRREFFDSFNKMIEKGTKPETKIRIETPLMNLTKQEVVEKSVKLNSPLHLTWSCYSETRVACGECDSCALRLRGFQLAGISDPIKYKTIPLYVR